MAYNVPLEEQGAARIICILLMCLAVLIAFGALIYGVCSGLLH
jgi:hypothetical protein